MPGGIKGNPVPGGHKHRDLVLKVGVFDARLTTLLCKKLTVAKSKELKPGWSNKQIWQDLLRKGMAQKGLFYERLWPIFQTSPIVVTFI
jgi:hypothetical protein